MIVHCERCKHWKKASTQIGICTRYPPIVVADHRDLKTVWPTTQNNEYCGEGEIDHREQAILGPKE